jgi:hypothetical protein
MGHTIIETAPNVEGHFHGHKPLAVVHHSHKSAPKQLPMVGWYDPRQLARTAVDVFWSTIVGQYADQRLLEAVTYSTNGETFFDYTVHYKTVNGDFARDHETEDLLPEEQRPREEIWIDYVSDVGDGWNPTYTIASYLAQPEIKIQSDDGTMHATKRGEVLILGGDQVYPVACPSEYFQRLATPYECAFHDLEGLPPHLFAIPGNHDWYDSLVSFSRLFISKSTVAGLPTRQTRSYFALKLPHGWWMLGTDLQLGSEMDGPQLQYFKRVAKRMQPGDRVIVCHAEPLWLASAKETGPPQECSQSNVMCLEHELLNQHVQLYLAGDLHHYRRHVELGEDKQPKSDGIQKITAGGGGAFLHPTHNRRDTEVMNGHPGEEKTFRTVMAWPSERVSRWLCWRNLFFPIVNPWFGMVPGALYMLTAWVTRVDLSRYGLADFLSALHETITTLVADPYRAIWMVTAFFGIVFFTDTRSRPFRYLGGGFHALTHFAAIFFIGWWATEETMSLGLPFLSISQLMAANVLIFATGWVIGSVILGLYLLISLNLFGRHGNEAFSSLRIEDWKHFLRLHIDRNGNLTIYPIGIKKVPTEWKERQEGRGSRVIPTKGGSKPELIEQPIVLKPKTAVELR